MFLLFSGKFWSNAVSARFCLDQIEIFGAILLVVFTTNREKENIINADIDVIAVDFNSAVIINSFFNDLDYFVGGPVTLRSACSIACFTTSKILLAYLSNYIVDYFTAACRKSLTSIKAIASLNIDFMIFSARKNLHKPP